MSAQVRKRFGAYVVANIAVFAYAFLSVPQSVSDMGTTASLTEAFGFLLGFNILAVGVWGMVFLIRRISRKTD